MAEDHKSGASAPPEKAVPEGGADNHPEHAESTTNASDDNSNTFVEPSYDQSQPSTTYTPTVDDSYGYYDDPYGYDPGAPATAEPAGTVARTSDAPPPPPPATVSAEREEPDDDEEDGMLRMSFLEHLEELRKRILLALVGIGIAFLVSLTFSEALWRVVQQPASYALASLGYKDTDLVFLSPMDSFSIIWMKLPILTSIFMASPWVLYQVWAFIAPGLYKKERRFAAPFVICSAGLFIIGGLFAYFVAFRFGLTFLLGIGRDVGVRPMITITDYFDIFVNVILGIGIVFELPILIFFLTLLRIASPGFLIRNARYAVLLIVILAAIVTPTPDIINLMLFSVPMVLLYFIGVFASYLLVLSRENRRFPWWIFITSIGIPLMLIAAGVYIATVRYGYKLVLHWPFLVR
jgi:sec-independent protein translocase protein TatC